MIGFAVQHGSLERSTAADGHAVLMLINVGTHGLELTRQLKAMGADIDEHEDGMTIRGGRPLKGAVLDSETDHRVAMSLGVAAMLADGNSSLARSEAAAVSYPSFWDELERLRC